MAADTEEAKKMTQALEKAAQAAAPQSSPAPEVDDDEPEKQQGKTKEQEDDPSLTDKFLKGAADIGWDSMKNAVTAPPPQDDFVMADLVKRGVQAAVGGTIYGAAKLAQGVKAIGEMAFDDSEKAKRIPEDGQEDTLTLSSSHAPTPKSSQEDSLTLSSPHSFFKEAYGKQQEAKEAAEAQASDSLTLKQM